MDNFNEMISELQRFFAIQFLIGEIIVTISVILIEHEERVKRNKLYRIS